MGSKYSELSPIIGTFTGYDGVKRTKATYEGYDYLAESEGGKHGRFQVYHVRNTGGLATGTNEMGDSFEAWGETDIRESGHLPISVSPIDWPQASTALYARTNPSKPSVDVPGFIGELKDLPSLFKSMGDAFIKGKAYGVGNAHLNLEFGWKPFMSDLVKLFLFQNLAAKRFKTLQKAASDGHLYRKITIEDIRDERKIDSRTSVWGAGTCPVEHSTEVKSRTWGYVFWKTQPETFPSTDSELLSAAYRSALGLYARPTTAWNLLPWSWMADWFTNVGDFLQAKENQLGFYPSLARVMREDIVRTKVRQMGNFTNGGVYLSPFKRETISRHRGIAYPPSITATLPILTGRQLGILSAITVTRRR